MRGLSAREILDVWEVGQFQMPAERALTLLSAFCPETPRQDLERMNIGKRDALLLAFRENLFGSQFSGLSSCPGCFASLEIGFDSSEVRTNSPVETGDTFSFSYGEYEFTYRLPNSADLLAVVRSNSDSAIIALLDRCLLQRRHRGTSVSLASLPGDAIDAIVAEMARLDPQADVRFALVCPDCSHQWEAIFDVVSFAWNEISAWAVRLLRQVHTLARAYGWREIDILSLSPLRRQAYLEMLGE